jgi:hypothetical protein
VVPWYNSHMRDSPKRQLDNLVTLLKCRTVTTRELRGVLRELWQIAAREPNLADEIQLVAVNVRERIRRAAS